MRVLRESKWVRVYETSDGEYVDSKYRTYECDANGREFVDAWAHASAEERRDLIAAFRHFPRPGSKAVIDKIRTLSRAAALELEQVAESASLAVGHREFLTELWSETGKTPITYVGDNIWFRASFDGVGFSFEDKAKAPPVTYESYSRVYESATTRIYRNAINLYFGVEPDVMADEETFKTLYSRKAAR